MPITVIQSVLNRLRSLGSGGRGDRVPDAPPNTPPPDTHPPDAHLPDAHPPDAHPPDALYEQSPIALALLTADGVVVHGNRAFATLFDGGGGGDGGEDDGGEDDGGEDDLRNGKPLQHLLAADDGSTLNQCLHALSSAQTPAISLDAFTRVADSQTVGQATDARALRIHLTRLPVPPAIAPQACLTAHIIDNSEAHRLMRDVVGEERLKFIGDNTAKITHEIRNALNITLSLSGSLLGRCSPSDPEYPDIKELRQSVDRCVDLTNWMMRFTRTGTIEPTIMNPATALSDIISLSLRVIGKRVDLDDSYGDNVRAVCMDECLFQNVVFNLIRNANDAMPDGGKLSLSMNNYTADTHKTFAKQTMPPGDYVHLRVADTGSGIKADYLDRVFDTRFTTKEKGKGTGYGLAQVYDFTVRLCGGYISVESSSEQGTAFELYFPALAAGVLPLSAEQPHAASEDPGSSGRVLFIDDDPSILRLTGRALRGFGYDVQAVSDAETGWKSLQGRERADIIVTDYQLPGMDGFALYRRVRTQWPLLPVIILSGDDNTLFATQAKKDDLFHAMLKPCDDTELAILIKRILHGSRRQKVS